MFGAWLQPAAPLRQPLLGAHLAQAGALEAAKQCQRSWKRDLQQPGACAHTVQAHRRRRRRPAAAHLPLSGTVSLSSSGPSQVASLLDTSTLLSSRRWRLVRRCTAQFCGGGR
jgi:hypothetical protein